MKLSSVKDLYLVKQMVLKEKYGIKIVELLNGVLLREGGSKAVLFPYNDLKETILELYGQSMNPQDIADKVGLKEHGEETVLCVVEDPTNYEEEVEEVECIDVKIASQCSQKRK